MFAKKITESDAFLDMPASSQALYFHLNMSADDDGFVNNPKKIQRMVGAADDDLRLLIAKKFIIVFESGVIVIKHWKMHNYIQSDRYRPTDYLDEKSMLEIKKNKAYTLNGHEMDTNCIQNVSVGKVRIGKDSIDKNNNMCGINPTDTPKKSQNFIPPALEEVQNYCKERNNTVDAERFVDFYTSKNWMVGKNKMKDWKAAIRSTWEKGNNQQATYQNPTKSNRDNFEQREQLDEYYSTFFNNT